VQPSRTYLGPEFGTMFYFRLPIILALGGLWCSSAELTQLVDGSGAFHRSITVATTAAIPWLTGTSINAAMRSAELARIGYKVTLVVPFVKDPAAQRHLFDGETFATPLEQEGAMREWFASQGVTSDNLPLTIVWFEAYWGPTGNSLVAWNPLDALPADHPRDILIAEEPERLTTFYTGACLKSSFRYVVGVIHTNYDSYFKDFGMPFLLRLWQAHIFESSICSSVDLVIRLSAFNSLSTPLSAAVPNEVVNVNGVAERFLLIGEEVQPLESPPDVAAYFLGKALWSKGYDKLIELAKQVPSLRIDTYGSGSEEDKIAASALKNTDGRMVHHAGIRHDDVMLRNYSVLINPATSDVLCTVTMEALAMGKHVVLVQDPSNAFFMENFPNRTFAYDQDSVKSFSEAYAAALAQGPASPLPRKEEKLLTWRSATGRFLKTALAGDLHRKLKGEEKEREDKFCSDQCWQMPRKQARMWQEAIWIGTGAPLVSAPEVRIRET